MHAKTMMIDNIATMIGSYNISGTSEKLSYEQVMVCHDEELAKEMQKSILQDILNSIPIPTEAL
jgi:phosphatidylserine/phosphatidylglycerophosphate/cardiolipin synthase-like enzyme